MEFIRKSTVRYFFKKYFVEENCTPERWITYIGYRATEEEKRRILRKINNKKNKAS